MKKLIVWTMALVFSLCVSLAFAADEKKPMAPADQPKAEEKAPAAKTEKKAKKTKKVKKEKKAAPKKEEKKMETPAPAAPAEKK